ncbi:MAG: hypothetical protein SF162_10140 [bacterium]|nr:hypothetical protein [bacterium]
MAENRSPELRTPESHAAEIRAPHPVCAPHEVHAPHEAANHDPGQSGYVPRVDIDLPLIDPADPPLPPDLPEMPDSQGATGFVSLRLLTEGDDRAKTADDSAEGSSDTASITR